MDQGDLVMVKLAGTIIEGHVGTYHHAIPKRQRWPELFVIILADDPYTPPDEEMVTELHLTYDEFWPL